MGDLFFIYLCIVIRGASLKNIYPLGEVMHDQPQRIFNLKKTV